MTASSMTLETTSLGALRGLPTAARVDAKRRVIYGAAMLQLGPLKEGDARPWSADEQTADQVLALARSQPKGVKARFKHPLAGDGLGSYLGRWRNWRMSDDGKTVLADLHLASVAFQGPDSKGSYVLSLAEEDPEAFGVSVFPILDKLAMQAADAVEGRTPMRFRRLIAADIVDEPAATSGGLFGGLSLADAPRVFASLLGVMFPSSPDLAVRDRVGDYVEQFLAARNGPSITTEASMPQTENQGAASLDVAAMTAEITKNVTAALSSQLEASLKPTEVLSVVSEVVIPTEEETKAAERVRCRELYALASNAGFADWQVKADGWIEKGLSVIEAKASLAEAYIAGNGLTKDAGADADPDAKFRAEYRAQSQSFASMGLTEDEYVASRKLD
jgi:hypothetical protein